MEYRPNPSVQKSSAEKRADYGEQQPPREGWNSSAPRNRRDNAQVGAADSRPREQQTDARDVS